MAGGDDVEDSAFIEEAGNSEEVGVRVEVGEEEEGCQARAFFRKRRGVGRQRIGCGGSNSPAALSI